VSEANKLYARWYRKQWSAVGAYLREQDRVIFAEQSRLIRAAQKRRQPRRRKNFDKLPEDLQEEIHQQLLKQFADVIRIRDAVRKARRVRAARLQTLWPRVTFEPLPNIWQQVDYCSSNTYRSQGWGKNKYARGSLLMYEELLKEHGYDCDVYRVFESRVEGRHYPGAGYLPSETYYGYALYANIEDWRYHALIRRGLSTEEEIELLEKHGSLNVMVYNPFLNPTEVMELWAKIREKRRKGVGQA